MKIETFTQSVERWWICDIERPFEHGLWNYFMVNFAISTECSSASADWEEYYQKSDCWEGSKYFKPLFAFIVSGSLFGLPAGSIFGYNLWKSSMEDSGGYREMVDDNARDNFNDGTTWTVPG